MKENSSESVQVSFSLQSIVLTYLSYAILILVGYFNDFFRNPPNLDERRKGYTPLYSSFEGFYTRNLFRRFWHEANSPVCGVPGGFCTILERTSPDNGWTTEFTGKKCLCINIASYNYLGFANNTGACVDASVGAIACSRVCVGSARSEIDCKYLKELDKLVAQFVGVEDAITCSMGYATNFLNIPSILDKNSFVVSDEMNHASIITGIKSSGAKVAIFKHNDMHDLENVLKRALQLGNPGTGRPWEKIFIFVEGIYSMEGTIVNLPEVLRLKKKYKAYLYLDEAHSIGALGPRGRGVCDYFGVDPKEVDILMGTFTKSFGSAGGYIAGSKSIINFIRRNSCSERYGGVMSAPVAAQIMKSMEIIGQGSEEGLARIQTLARNIRYFRQRLQQLRFVVYGDGDSPVVPVAVQVPSKLSYICKEMRRYGIAVVVVAFPATPLLEGRVRFCLSASHTKEMLDHVLTVFTKIGEDINLRFSRDFSFSGQEITY